MSSFWYPVHRPSSSRGPTSIVFIKRPFSFVGGKRGDYISGMDAEGNGGERQESRKKEREGDP
jgi:hypothetical protein